MRHIERGVYTYNYSKGPRGFEVWLFRRDFGLSVDIKPWKIASIDFGFRLGMPGVGSSYVFVTLGVFGIQIGSM